MLIKKHKRKTSTINKGTDLNKHNDQCLAEKINKIPQLLGGQTAKGCSNIFKNLTEGKFKTNIKSDNMSFEKHYRIV